MVSEDMFTDVARDTAVVMLEVPEEEYFRHAVHTIKDMLGNGFSGVYVSFQRPAETLRPRLEEEGVDTDKLWFIDVASALGDTGNRAPDLEQCTHIGEDIEIDELVRAVYTALDDMETGQKFIFIDSITTISLYKPLSETLRFCEFLRDTVQDLTTQKIVLFFNVAEGLAQKQFIKDIALHVDKTVPVSGDDRG